MRSLFDVHVSHESGMWTPTQDLPRLRQRKVLDQRNGIAKYHFVQHLPLSLCRVSSSKKTRVYNTSDVMVGSLRNLTFNAEWGKRSNSWQASASPLQCRVALSKPNTEETSLILFNLFRLWLIVIRCSIMLITNINRQKALWQLHCPKLRLQRLNNLFPILMMCQ